VVDISDHLPVFTVIPNNANKNYAKRKITKRIFSQENLAKFKLELHTHDWHTLNAISDVNNMYSRFIDDVQHIYVCAPFWRVRRVQRALT
jgi:hypothetical protein